MLSCLCCPKKKCYKLQPILINGARITYPVMVPDSAPAQNQTQLDAIPTSNGMEKPQEVQHRRSGVRAVPVSFNENSVAISKYPKSPSEEELIKKAIEANEFLRNVLQGDRLKSVIETMYSRDVNPREVIIRECEPGAHMYVSASGSYEVLVKGKVVNSFSDQRVFGEIAILYNARRNATIKATEAGRLWVLDQAVFQKIMVQGNIDEQEEMYSFLKRVPKLNTVGEETLYHVAKLLNKEFFNTGTVIVRQGDRGDKFYIIRAGTVTISKENEGVVNTYERGQFFGELALLKEDYRQATVTADAPGVECFTLDRTHFIEHFGNVDLDQIHIERKSEEFLKENSEYSDIEFSDLQFKKTLGVGGFGRVELVVHKSNTNLTFALKCLRKTDMIKQQQQEHVFNEKNLQMSCNCIFIVRLYKTYQNSKYLYFLMETCLGGDLFSLLHKQPTRYFEESAARFISACVLEALAYLHDRKIIYRDLKPENIMIDSQGYIKLTDFGFAKRLDSHGKTFTFAGTPEYVAPEIVLNRGHDKAIDYWAFGIFIFELLVGKTPFISSDRSHIQTYNYILKGIDNIVFPSRVSRTAQHLIKKLCRPVPIERLGCAKGGMQDVRNHRWFVGFDFAKLYERKIKAPFPPKLKGNTDTRYFDNFTEENDIPEDDVTDCFKDF